MKEQVVRFGPNRSLVGILTEPSPSRLPAKLPTVILINSGLANRVGHNRLYVRIARRLSKMGLVALRFDLSGIGDSAPPRDHVPFKQMAVRETREAMDYLNRTNAIDWFILMGICSGANVSYATACCDLRVRGAILINAIGHLHVDREDLNTYYYNRSLSRHYRRILLHSSFSLKNWGKALTGKIDYRKLFKLVSGFTRQPFFRSPAAGDSAVGDATTQLEQLLRRGLRLFVIHSEADEGLDYFRELMNQKIDPLCEGSGLSFEIIKGANHTFTLLWSQDYLLSLIQAWIHDNIGSDDGGTIDKNIGGIHIS